MRTLKYHLKAAFERIKSFQIFSKPILGDASDLSFKDGALR
jgi:hypothetical protein